MKHGLPALAAFGLLALGACADAPTALAPRANAVASTAPDGQTDGTFLVRFNGNGVPAGFAERVAQLGGEVMFAHPTGVAAVSGLSAAAADQLAASADVAAVDADGVTELEPAETEAELAEAAPESPTDPTTAARFPRQWNMKAIQADVAWAAGKPLIAIDHVHAHLYSVLLDQSADVQFPAVGLVCSGGHTALYRVGSWLDVELIGSTIDDAVGEAYDKVAALLGLG